MRALLVATTLVVAGSLTACGGGDGGSSAPTSASTDDFCTAYNSLFDSISATEPPSDAESVQALRDWADELEQTGTPKEMSEAARRGFEVVVKTVQSVDKDASQADIQKLSDDFTADETSDSEAFGKYATETCPTPMPDMPEIPEMPSEGATN